MKPSNAKGTRDFTPVEMLSRQYIFNTIREVFQRYAYLPIETPAVENLSTLMGKYGKEGERLLFKILNSGDFSEGVDFSTPHKSELALKICEKGLRYDLTVPFARFVAQHREEIQFPFKRYQIQQVWRADRPQKGRYREFYQCDADVIGSTSQICEAELIKMAEDIFSKLGINCILKLNNRKILAGIAECVGAKEFLNSICVAIDKIDKIGVEKVCEELKINGMPETAVEKLIPILSLGGSTASKLQTLEKMFEHSETGLKGLTEIKTLLKYIEGFSIKLPVELDFSLARGLNYYTGAIFEVKPQDVEMGSIAGGGRYDNLTGIFGLNNMSGVGISFGAERIYDILKEKNLFPTYMLAPVKVLFANFGEAEILYGLPALNELRKIGINAEIYPDNAKMAKQFTYADSNKIPFVVIAGEQEMQDNCFTVKDMLTGEQKSVPYSELTIYLMFKF